MADPWLKFYPQDWRADERLRNCSLTARGLWMEMIALMHRSDRYGHLLVNGKQPSVSQLAVQVGATIEQVEAGLAELESEGVFSRDRNDAIYSRRMIRDEKKANHARKVGKKGGNPKLGKQKENPAQDNHEDNQRDIPEDKPQIPEARSQRTTDKSVVSAKVRLPDEWEPEPFTVGTQCRSIVDGWSPSEFERQVESFKAHHEREGSKFVNWQAAWKTWALNSVKFGNQRDRDGGSTWRRSEDLLEIVIRENGVKVPP